MSEGVRVCALDELSPGERTIISVAGASIGVLNVDGELYAIQNHCPHQHGPVCKGTVRPELKGEFAEPGERVKEYHGERPTIACPWHGWEYDLETGTHLGVDDIALETYDVYVADGTIYIDDPADSAESR